MLQLAIANCDSQLLSKMANEGDETTPLRICTEENAAESDSEAVRQQLQLWDALLECRIKLQTPLNTICRLPAEELVDQDEKAVKNVQDKLSNLLLNLSECQQLLTGSKTERT